MLIASTDKSYGDHADADDPEALPYGEAHALRGMDVYSASKACADLIAQTYGFQFKLPALIFRSCNIYGAGDLNFSRLIPRTTLRMLNGKAPVINLGNADVLREYIYVDDVVKAYMFLGREPRAALRDEMPRTGRSTYGWAAYNVGWFTSAERKAPAEYSNIKSVRQVIDQVGDCRRETEPVTIPKARELHRDP